MTDPRQRIVELKDWIHTNLFPDERVAPLEACKIATAALDREAEATNCLLALRGYYGEDGGWQWEAVKRFLGGGE